MFIKKIHNQKSHIMPFLFLYSKKVVSTNEMDEHKYETMDYKERFTIKAKRKTMVRIAIVITIICVCVLLGIYFHRYYNNSKGKIL